MLSLGVELPRTISIPFNLDEIAYHSWAVFNAAGFGDVVPEFLHVPGGGGAAFGVIHFTRSFQ